MQKIRGYLVCRLKLRHSHECLTFNHNERQIMTRLEKRIRAKFSRIEALRASGNHKDVKVMSDDWTKRISSNVRGFYDNKKARVIA